MVTTRDEDIVAVHLGKRLRIRRRLLRLTQKQLAQRCGLLHQQIQKYECGKNSLSAARLWLLAEVLECSISYFYEGLAPTPPGVEGGGDRDVYSRRETVDLIQAYYQLDENPRRRLLELTRSLQEERRVEVSADAPELKVVT